MLTVALGFTQKGKISHQILDSLFAKLLDFTRELSRKRICFDYIHKNDILQMFVNLMNCQNGPMAIPTSTSDAFFMRKRISTYHIFNIFHEVSMFIQGTVQPDYSIIGVITLDVPWLGY
jgi:hypothetical protein